MAIFNLQTSDDIVLYSLTNMIPLVLLLYTVHCFVQYMHLRQFKGPPTVGFSKLWLLRCMRSGAMHTKFQGVNQTYGKIARIGPRSLLTSDVEYIKRMNAPRSSYRRSDWYKGGRFVPNEDTLLTMTDDVMHKALRLKMTPGYNTQTENERVESSIDGQLTIMLNLINSKYLSNLSTEDFKPMDLGYIASYFAIDSITDIAFSEALGDLQEDTDKFNFVHSTKAALPIMSVFICYNWMLKLLQSKYVARLIAPGPDDNSPFGHVMGFARKRARERFGPNKIERRDMLGAFLRHGIEPGEAERAGILQLVAGSDTVATVLRAAVLWIATSPIVLSRLRHELHAAGVPLDRPTSSIISNAKARSIPYLAAIFKETLRMHPPAVGTLEKQAGSKGDTLPDGRLVPAGTKVGVSIWAVQRDPETFGDDAEVFRPERWLEVEDEQRKRKMDSAVDVVFGAGRFVCMGKEIAMTQCLKVISELFCRFEITIINPELPWRSVAYGIFCQHDMWVRMTKWKTN